MHKYMTTICGVMNVRYLTARMVYAAVSVHACVWGYVCWHGADYLALFLHVFSVAGFLWFTLSWCKFRIDERWMDGWLT